MLRIDMNLSDEIEKYARSIGKNPADLTKDETRMAIAKITIGYGKRITAGKNA